MWQGRRFRSVIIAGDDQHAAVFTAAGRVGMAEYIARPIHAGTFAVPHGIDAINFRAGMQIHLLCTPDGGRSQVLIDPWLEDHTTLGQVRFCAEQRLIDRTQR